MRNCLFCKIVDKKIPSDIVYEDKRLLVVKDINPKAALHFLILTKKHIESVNHLKNQDKELVGLIFLVAKKIAKAKKLKGYKLVVNVGRKGGQLIDHLHIHFLSGKSFRIP